MKALLILSFASLSWAASPLDARRAAAEKMGVSVALVIGGAAMIYFFRFKKPPKS